MAGLTENHASCGQDGSPPGVTARFIITAPGDEIATLSLRDRIFNLPPDFGRREVVLAQTLYQLNEDGSGFAHPTWDDIYHAAYSDITADYTPQDFKIAKHSARLKWQKVVSKLAASLAVPREKRPGNIGRINTFIDAQRDITVYAGLSDEDFLNVASREITFEEILQAANNMDSSTTGDGVVPAQEILREEVLGGNDENLDAVGTTDTAAQEYIEMVDASEGMARFYITGIPESIFVSPPDDTSTPQFSTNGLDDISPAAEVIDHVVVSPDDILSNDASLGDTDVPDLPVEVIVLGDKPVVDELSEREIFLAGLTEEERAMVIEIDEAEALTSAFTHNRDVFKQFNQPDVPQELIEAIRVEIERVNPPIPNKQIRERERDAVNRFWSLLRKDNNDFPMMYGLQSDTIRQVLDYFIGNRGRELLMEALYNKLIADTEEADNLGSGFDGSVRALPGKGSKRTHMSGAWPHRD